MKYFFLLLVFTVATFSGCKESNSKEKLKGSLKNEALDTKIKSASSNSGFSISAPDG